MHWKFIRYQWYVWGEGGGIFILMWTFQNSEYWSRFRKPLPRSNNNFELHRRRRKTQDASDSMKRGVPNFWTWKSRTIVDGAVFRTYLSENHVLCLQDSTYNTFSAKDSGSSNQNWLRLTHSQEQIAVCQGCYGIWMGTVSRSAASIIVSQSRQDLKFIKMLRRPARCLIRSLFLAFEEKLPSCLCVVRSGGTEALRCNHDTYLPKARYWLDFFGK